VLPVFSWLAKLGGISAHEMLRTFNCGIGMVIVVGADGAEATKARLTEMGETVVELGSIAPGPDEPYVEPTGALRLDTTGSWAASAR
jgi:phosphoribosylaminoimidazole (AIR) synthetase